MSFKELGLDISSLHKNYYHKPKQPSMEGEKKDDGTWDPFKMLLEEDLEWQMNETMDKFEQILRQLPTRDVSSSSWGPAAFKVQIIFYIPIFEGQIDADVVDKWLNMP